MKKIWFYHRNRNDNITMKNFANQRLCEIALLQLNNVLCEDFDFVQSDKRLKNLLYYVVYFTYSLFDYI
jgi:hypothetical protein